MAVNLPPLPVLIPVAGVRLGTTVAELRKKGRRDLVVVEIPADSAVAAVFTRNRFSAAPVQIAQSHLAAASPRGLVINTGYANAGTGDDGLADARASCQALASQLGCRAEQILPFSTGVIGERYPLDRLVAALPRCIERFSEDGWTEAAHGIMTTDTMPKGSSRRVPIRGQMVTVTGIAKGAGMICPNMATMLAFVATDARVSQAVLQKILGTATNSSFNRISVDGDTSTNDACVLIATGTSGVDIGDLPDDSFAVFAQVVKDVMAELAQAIVRDAEGATKFITIDVDQGTNEAECLEVAQTVAHSPLVKTAFFASDPNWGRILAAVGRARVPHLDANAVSIYLDDVCIVRKGGRAAEYTEAQGMAIMRQAEIRVRIVLGHGQASARLWTCDLSTEYVQINADYRT